MFRNLLNSKIGNILIYFSENAAPLSLTKALKLLFLLDETSVKETGVPVTWLDYKVWRLGPVAKQIYLEFRNGQKECLNNEILSLDPFVEANEESIYNKRGLVLKAKVEFNDDEFSDYEIELLDEIVRKFGNWTATELVDFTHKSGSLWSQIVEKYDLAENLELLGSSDHPVDFFEHIKGDEEKRFAYKSAYDALTFQAGLQDEPHEWVY